MVDEKILVREIKNYSVPKDWNKYEMGELFNFSGGMSLARNKFTDDGVPYLHYGDIHTSKKISINVKKEKNKLPKIDISLNNVKQETLLKHGDLVFVDASEDYEGTSKYVTIENSENIPFISGLHTIVAKSKNKKIDNEYKKYCFKNWDIKKQIAFFVTGISVFGLSKSNISKVVIPLPPISEQQKIANILSTYDKCIGLKEKLIKQKKLEKKFLMQALLDPESPNFLRLPGFKDKWEEVKIGDIISEVSEKTSRNDQYPIFSITKNGIKKQSDYFKKQIASENNIGYKIIKENYLIISCMNLWMGSLDILKENIIGVVSPAYKTFIVDCRKNDIDFINNYFKTRKMKYLYKVNSRQGASIVRRNLNLRGLLLTKIEIPTYNEQKAIAEILITADMGIDLLEKELEQEKLQKKALMQLLLTGKVRVNT